MSWDVVYFGPYRPQDGRNIPADIAQIMMRTGADSATAWSEAASAFYALWRVAASRPSWRRA